jgi:TonB family protein
MKQQNLQHSQTRHRLALTGLVPLAVIAIAMTLPLHAADDHGERAVKQRVSPTYPELARRMHVSGVVRIAATVTPEGTVSATKTVSGNHMLSEAAEDAVHKWKFVPGPAESTVEVTINFAPAE